MEPDQQKTEVADKTGKKQPKRGLGKPFPKGKSGNPKGRPKGSLSIRDEIRKHLEANPDEVKEIVEHFIKKNRELMWQMLEGKPKMQMEVDVDKDTLAELTSFFKLAAGQESEKKVETKTDQVSENKQDEKAGSTSL